MTKCLIPALSFRNAGNNLICVCVTTLTAAVLHIMLEAYKKYQLVGLLVHGDKDLGFGRNVPEVPVSSLQRAGVRLHSQQLNRALGGRGRDQASGDWRCVLQITTWGWSDRQRVARC